jgi:hypothetical protein
MYGRVRTHYFLEKFPIAYAGYIFREYVINWCRYLGYFKHFIILLEGALKYWAYPGTIFIYDYTILKRYSKQFLIATFVL